MTAELGPAGGESVRAVMKQRGLPVRRRCEPLRRLPGRPVGQDRYPATGHGVAVADRVETVLFDLDGTITDSADGIVASYRHALGRFGLCPSDDEIRRCIGPPLVDSFATLGVAAGSVEEAIDVYREYFSTVGIRENRLYAGVTELLDELALAGIRIGLATSKLSEYAESILNHLGVATYFEVVVGSTRDGSRLQKEDIVGYALAELGEPSPPAVAMVGDRKHDVSAARLHRVRAIGVTWGYGSIEELREAGAHAVVDTPHELGALLLSGRRC